MDVRVSPIDVSLLNDEIINEHLKEVQFKYLTAYTNLNNIKAMVADVKKSIENGEGDEKTLEIALDEQNNQLKSHIKAVKLHKKNINYLNKLLGV